MAPDLPNAIVVLDGGRRLRFSLEDLSRYHGFGSPGGVAHALRVMERAWPLLDPDSRPERRELTIETAFGGSGARDAFELVTRAVTEAATWWSARWPARNAAGRGSASSSGSVTAAAP